MWHPVWLLVLASLGLASDVRSHTQLTTSEDEPCAVWGQIVGAGRSLADGLDVELVGRDRAATQKVHASPTGNFDFRTVPTGEYQFRVVDRSGAVIHEQTELLGGERDSVLLLVPDPRLELSANNTVSYAALHHKTSGRAWDAFRAAQKATAGGDLNKCVQRLQEALSIDPGFAEAHSDLAANYAKLGRTEEALTHAQTAFNLNPGLPQTGFNFALLLVSLKRYPEAEVTARQMLKGSYYLPELHGVLAISLIGQRGNLDEAFDHLRQAAPEIPFVTLLAARTLIEIGKPDLAVTQVRTYLQSYAHACERQELEAWMTSVQSQLASKK